MNRIIGIYKAEIYEYENGDIRIAYECDKSNCKEEYCTHTLNKRFAKNKMKRSNCPPIELELHPSG